jgi:uncharacterized protein YndB with AHSA1/START domain
MMSIAAAVVTLAANGFLVRHEVAVAAPPAKVYEALAGKVGSWWSSKHTYSGDAANLSIDARAGGCFCEKLKDGGSVEHMRVVFVAPNSAVRMSGALGPLQAHGLAGSLTWRLVPAGDATTLSVTYSVGGFMDGGFEKIAPAVDGVLGEQVQRLKSYAEGK